MKANFIIILMLALCVHKSSAQIITNNASITINPGASIQANGTMQSNTGAAITNFGTITVTEDFINNSGTNLFTPTLVGSVIMPSITNQNIAGNTVTRFVNLNLSGGTKTLQVDAEVGGSGNGVLSIGNSIVNLNSKTMTVLNPSASGLTFNSGIGYILSETDPNIGYGTLIRLVKDTAGAVTYDFPFGNPTTNLLYTYGFSNGISAAGQIGMATYPTLTSNAPNNRPLPTGLSSLVNFFGVENAANTIDRFWVVSSSGFLTSSAATITMRYAEPEWQSGTNTIVESTMLPQRHNFTSWSAPFAATVNAAANTVSLSGVTQFNGVWTLAGNSSPLPVSLVDFKTTCERDGVALHWSTATETNNSHFTLQYSDDGSVFYPLTQIPGNGTTTQMSFYNYLDSSASEHGSRYYKLSQTDLDGGMHELGLTRANCIGNLSNSNITVFPNPFSDFVQIMLQTESEGKLRVSVIDVTGRVVKLQEEFTKIGFNGFQLDLQSLAPGSYSLLLEGDSLHSLSRLVKAH
ncbi:MAG: T9SS type A sorting domain-containing protein [Arcticibacter sp.]